MISHETHTFGPIYDAHSRILILGSFPSVKSREQGFYYGHPQNRFWKVLAAICQEEAPREIPEKKEFLLRHHIALWDVIASCDIEGSSDSSIRNVRVNDIEKLLEETPLERVFTNGRKSFELYRKYIREPKAICLPSTSPANAAWSLEHLIEAWRREISEFLIIPS